MVRLRLITLAAIALASGAAVAASRSDTAVICTFFILLGSGTIYALQTRYRLRNAVRVTLCLLLFWASFGIEARILRKAEAGSITQDVSALSGAALTPQTLRTTGGTAFELSADAADDKPLAYPIKIQVQMPDRREGPALGQRLRVAGNMAETRQALNPGEERSGSLSEQLFLARDIQLLPTHTLQGLWGRWSKRLYRTITIRARKLLSYKAFGLLNELLLHYRTFGAADRQLFSLSGTSHLLAISGLHLSFIFILISTVFGVMFPEHSTGRALLPLGITFAYLAFINFPQSANRAFVMLCVITASRILGKHVSKLESLSWAVAVLIVLDPSCIFDVGLQLSLASVAGLFFIGEPLTAIVHVKNRFWHPFLKSLCTTAGASLPASIIAIPAFHSFTPVAFLANIVAIPFVSLLLPCLVIWSVLLLITPWLAAVLAPLLNILSAVLFSYLAFLVRLPGAHANVAVPSAATFVAFGILFASLVLFVDNSSRIRNNPRVIIVLGSLALLTAVLWFCSPVRADIRVTFPATDQGSAVLIQGRNTGTWLYLCDTDRQATDRTMRTAAAMGITTPDVIAITGSPAELPDQLDAIFAVLAPRHVYLTDTLVRFPIPGLEDRYQKILQKLNNHESLRFEHAGTSITLSGTRGQQLSIVTPGMSCLVASDVRSSVSFSYDTTTHNLSIPGPGHASLLSPATVGCISLFARGSRCWVALDSRR